MPKVVVVLSVLVFWIAVGPARALADWPYSNIALQCDANHNRALLRFGEVYNNDPKPNTRVTRSIFDSGLQDVPNEIEKAWSDVGYQIAGDCRLSNGTRLSTRLSRGPSSAGYPIPDAFVTLLINSRIAYYEAKFLVQNSSNLGGFLLSAIEYDNGRLKECDLTRTVDESVAETDTCHDASKRLSHDSSRLAAAETFSLQRDRARTSLRASLSSFCRVLLQKYDLKGIPNEPSIWIRANADGPGVKTIDSGAYVDPHGNRGPYVRFAMDLLGNGKFTDVISISGSSRFFEGSYLFLIKEKDQADRFVYDIKNGLDVIMIRPDVALKQYGATLIQGPQSKTLSRTNLDPRYRTNAIVRLDHRFYLYSSGLDPRSVPAAVLSRFEPNSSIKTVCEFP